MGDINEMTMEEYMARTRTKNGVGVVRLKFEENVAFEIEGHIMKELRDTSFDGTNEEDDNEHVEKAFKKHLDGIHVTWAQFGGETKTKDIFQLRDHLSDALTKSAQKVLK
ncbi:hypothetical protein Tco_0607906 [Tanacetum coccineum]